MPERARTGDRDQDEALLRSLPSGGSGTHDVDDGAAFRALRSGPAAGPGATAAGARGMNAATLMAMQRLAGNRATVQTLARRPRMNGQPEVSRIHDEEEAIGGADSGESLAMANEADTAAGVSGGMGGGSGTGAGTGGDVPPGGATGSRSDEWASGRSGSSLGNGSRLGAGSKAGGDVKAGEAAGGKSGTSSGDKADEVAAKGSGTKLDSKSTEIAARTRPAGGGSGAASSSKSGEVAVATRPPRRTAPPPRRTAPPPIVAGAQAGEAASRTEVAGGSSGTAGAAQAIAATGGGSGGAAGMAGMAGPNSTRPAGAAGGGGTGGGPAAGPVAAPGAGPAASPVPAPGATPAVAPASPARTGPGGLPAPEAASTGIDWGKMLSDYGPPARTVLELTRMVPGWGLLGGMAADSINFASDIQSIPNSQNADLATGLIVFRNVVNVGNNGLGHIMYVNQLIQDGLAGSVVGAEFTPLTAAANEALSTVKVVLDEVVMGTDIIVEVESLYQSNHAPTSAEAEQWRALADGYAANILGDVVNLVLDVISLSSAGAANTAPVQQGRQPLTLAAAFMKSATPNIISAVNGVLGVWLGSLVTGGRHAFVGSPTELREQSLVLDGAGLVVEVEGTKARTTYDGINVVIDAMSAYAEDQVAQINTVAMALSGGKSAFELIRDAVQSSLDDMARKLDMVQELGAAASDGQANAAAITEACDAVLGALDGMVLPSVTLPSVDLGDGVMADAAAAVANEAAELANEAVTEAMSSVSEALETAKDSIRGPVEAAKSQAEGLGEWLAILAEQCATMAGTLGGQISTFSEGLGRCTNVEQVIDLIIGQVSDLTGMPRVTVAEIRAAWTSVGPYIDQFIDLGTRMHTRASDLRSQADLVESGGEMDSTPAPPAEQPPNPSGGTGTGGAALPAAAAP